MTSMTECCLTTKVEIEISTAETRTKSFHAFGAGFYFSHTEAMPMEYATCSDGQTPEGVSKA